MRRLFALLSGILVAGLLLASHLGSASAATKTATLSVVSQGTQVVLDTFFNVDIKLNTGGQAVGGVRLTLNTSTNLQFLGGNAEGSDFASEVSPITINGNTITAARVRLDAGYNGTTGQVVRLVFKPTAVGTATVTLDQANSEVVAYEDSTNILNSVVNGSYTVTQETVATPTITPSSAEFTAPINVSISTATAGAEVRYTTDGTEPTKTSPLFNTAFIVAKDTTVKAKAFKTNLIDSATASVSYVRVKPTVTLTKAVDKSEVKKGENLVYTLTYKNTSTADATTIVLTDPLPAQTTFVSASDGGSLVGTNTVKWQIPRIAAGATGQVTLTVKVGL